MSSEPVKPGVFSLLHTATDAPSIGAESGVLPSLSLPRRHSSTRVFMPSANQVHGLGSPDLTSTAWLIHIYKTWETG